MFVPLQVPEKVRRTAELLGKAGHVWHANLPQHILEIERRWALRVGHPFRNGTEAFVANARTACGQDVVLKMVIPGIDPAHREIRTLRAAMGRGYANLIRADDDRNIMLIERLGPQLQELGLPPDRQIEIICATLHDAWLPLLDGPPFVTATEKAVELARIIESNWSALDKPCSERTIDLALSYAKRRRLAFDPAHPYSSTATPINGICSGLQAAQMGQIH
jgi:streptomycin 6-kinase